MKSRKTSRFRGVNWHGTKWIAQIALRRRNTPIGLYDDEETAAIAYDRAALYLLGDRAVLNFPDRGTQPASPVEMHCENWQDFKQTTSSRYTGVQWSDRVGKWRAFIQDGKKRIHLGDFDIEEDAARAYDRAALRIRGGAQKPQWINFE